MPRGLSRHIEALQTEDAPKPILFSVKDGVYDSASSVPRIHVKADGEDQPVTGQSYDTIAVKERPLTRGAARRLKSTR